MIDTLYTTAKMIAAILPFAVLCIAGKGVNLEKADRSGQYLMPVLAIIYSAMAMLLLNWVSGGLLNFIYGLPGRIKTLAVFLSEIGSLGNVLTRAADMLASLIEKLNMEFWIFFISNTVLIAAYLIIKKICLVIIKRTNPEESPLHEYIAERFYEYFAETDKWCVKTECVRMRELLKVFYYTAVILSAVLMLVSAKLYEADLIKAVYYPVFGVLIVGELYFYLDGLTRKEYAENVLGEDEDAYRIVNYTLIRKFLRNLFGDKLLAENTSVNSDIFGVGTNDEIIESLEKSEDPKVNAFALYYKALNKTGFDLDRNYISSSLDLLEGKSILFNNPFYNDLIPYVFYPMNRALLRRKKVLVVLGRHSTEDDIVRWVEDGISAVTNIPFLWKIKILSDEDDEETDIGIITRSDVSNINLHNTNAEFLDGVGFAVILEPSRLISTAQIGLSLIASKCGSGGKGVAYCMCDKNCDGLVDAMSHILKTSITEVSATKKHLGTSSYMCWDADADYLHHRIVPNISRYLGLGTELSFAALKNQVSKAKWYGGECFPVTDMKWIDKQYYYDLMKYAGLPATQDAMDERFETSANYWSAPVAKHNYLTVEDESYNMFEILRNFATRSTEQGFINVISTEYLLKDYMTDNAAIFEADAKAVPRIVADFARSNRNVALKLILMMSTYPVEKSVLEKELSLIGIEVYSLKKQLWYEIYRCFSNTDTLNELSDSYKDAVEQAAGLSILIDPEERYAVDINMLIEADTFNIKSGHMERTYEITDGKFLKRCVSGLQSAGYISEDELGDAHYLGAELIGNVYQKYLPGQFFTFGGKYYEMRYLTTDEKILVRRAADHIVGRPSYRQIRDYKIFGTRASEQIGSAQSIAGLKVSREYADIRVSARGYYRMEKYNDFASAKKVVFEGDKSGIPDRTYYNKEILKIELPVKDGALTDNVRYTLAVMMNEIFRTLFAENQAYIVALTDASHVAEDCANPLTYSLCADEPELMKNCIYIVEDSQLDLGLTVAVERNLRRIFEILHDYIDWHMDALDKSLNPPPEPVPPVSLTPPPPEPEDEEKSVIKRIINWFKKKFKRKKKDDAAPVGEAAKAELSDGGGIDAEEIEEAPAAHEADGDIVYVTENEEIKKNPPVFTRAPYHERYYLLYGGEEEPEAVDAAGTLKYLSLLGFEHNPLKQARAGKGIAELVEATFTPGKANVRYCDFCGCEIYGVEYENLADGRERCINCGRTAVKTGEEFKKIFEDVKRNMESFFGIKINAGIRVEMVNSKKLHRALGKTFIPTPASDGRVLGVAINGRNGYTLMVENGAPRMASMLTVAHELTHIWQYLNWDDKHIVKNYGKELRLEIYEGMAKWVEIQYAYLINEAGTAKREEIITASRKDEYGRGFLRYLANYPFSLGTVVVRDTPFMFGERPLRSEFCGDISYAPQNSSGTSD